MSAVRTGRVHGVGMGRGPPEQTPMIECRAGSRQLYMIEDPAVGRFRVHRSLPPEELWRRRMDMEPCILVNVKKEDAEANRDFRRTNGMLGIFSRYGNARWERGYDPDASEWYIKVTAEHALRVLGTLDG